jgi:hypothetical protein
MVISSSEIKYKDEVNQIVDTFHFQKITYQGVEGFFIPLIGYNTLIMAINDFVYLQKKYELKSALINSYDKVLTGLNVSIAIAVTEFILLFVVGFFCYSLAKYK